MTQPAIKNAIGSRLGVNKDILKGVFWYGGFGFLIKQLVDDYSGACKQGPTTGYNKSTIMS